MSAAVLAPIPIAEHLTPHDVVTYFRCPYEMELARATRGSARGTAPSGIRTPAEVVPLRRSPLEAPIAGSLPFNGGRPDVLEADLLVYEDEGEEEELPMLFPPERVRPDPVFRRHGANLVDEELGLSGRPDLILARPSAGFLPIEYKSTHPFHGLHETHGRPFDVIQVLLECRLVEAVTGHRPAAGVLWYGDVAGEGAHEGWFNVPFGAREAAWVRYALLTIRGDATRAPVPSERTCSSCPAHRDHLCRFAAGRFEETDAARSRYHAPERAFPRARGFDAASR